MIKKLIVKNYRCFDNSTLWLQNTSILVGKNNAGKSTLIEALKIIATIDRKYSNLNFVFPPEWVPNETDKGVMPNMDNQGISEQSIFNMYKDGPAIIEALFENGCSIRAYIGDGLSVFALIFDKDGNPVRSRREAQKIKLPTIEVLPQISALLERENELGKTTITQNKNTRLTSRNFRNQLFLYQDKFDKFKSIVESTWEGLTVRPVTLEHTDDGQFLQLLVNNNNYTGEIAWMGHGLQMWMQCMWFISQCQGDSIVILDEPDVYMHADLQRRLIRLVAPMFSQLIVATHSIEIMEEVTPESIIPVDNHKKVIKAVGNSGLLQKLVDGMGSTFNLDLARLFISKRFMIWEGPDTDRILLSKFQALLYPRDLYSISTFPKACVNGWGGWQKAEAIAEIFKNNKINVKCYCVFDSDYHTVEEINERKQMALEKRLNLHIWERKEIENYAIHPAVIYRYISNHKTKGNVSLDIVEETMNDIAESMKEEVFNSIATEFQNKDRGLAFTTAKKIASVRMIEIWKNPYNVVSGKQFIKNMSTWSKRVYGVSFQAMNLIPFFKEDEIPIEIKEVVSTIVDGKQMVN